MLQKIVAVLLLFGLGQMLLIASTLLLDRDPFQTFAAILLVAILQLLQFLFEPIHNHKTLLLNLGKILLILLASLFFLSEPIRRRYSYFINIADTAHRLFGQMQLLERKMIMDSPPQGPNMANAWYSGVESISEEVADFEADYERWRDRAFFSRVWSMYGMAVRAGYLLEKVVVLQKVNVDAKRQMPPPPIQECDVVFDLEHVLQRALGHLQDPGPRVIGIVGMGGVGKTTLLKMINNFFASRMVQASSNNVQSQITTGDEFHHIVWATVSMNIDLKKIQEELAQSLGLYLPRNKSFYQRSHIIYSYMKDKNFLLLLDDLWAYLELEQFGIPDLYEAGHQLRRKVVFTTRSETVCNDMQAMEKIKMECLTHDHSWMLFKRMVGKEFDHSDREIVNLGRRVANQCAGLPLALKVIGAAVLSRKSVNDWEDALRSLNNSQPISGIEESLFRTLKHSYDYLNDDRMKECFLCCALWPKGWSIKENELIQCWMGFGLLDSYPVDSKYPVGRKYIRVLKAKCLLEAGDRGDPGVKIHNLIRDLALQIVSNKHIWMVRAGIGLEEAPIYSEHWEVAESVSLIDNKITHIPISKGSGEEALSFYNLSTLMLQNNNLLEIPNSFFLCIPNLTYLDLSHNDNLKELPGEICNLTRLKYLNLSFTGITSLPQELGRLEKLSYLFLRSTTSLNSDLTPVVMPGELQVLDLYGSSIDWEARGEEIFRVLNKLQLLGIKVRSFPRLHMLSKLSKVNLQSIWIENINDMDSIDITRNFEDFEGLKIQLEELKISQLYNLKELKVDFTEQGSYRTGSKLWNLEYLSLAFLSNLEKIIWKGVQAKDLLPSLRALRIVRCDKLENVSWVLQLPLLDILSVKLCNGMKMLIDEIGIGEGTTDVAFPCLKRLELVGLPNLQGIYRGTLAFPSLETIQVYNCPKLKSLPFRWPLMNRKLKQIEGSEEWWDRLQWEDEHIRSSLHTLFHP